MGLHDTAVCCDGRSDSICPSLGANPDFANGKSPSHHNRASSMLYGWCNTEGFSYFTNSLRHIDLTIQAKDFELWFVRPNVFIPQLYCPVLVCLGLLEPFDIVLLLQLCFLDSNTALYQLHRIFSSQWMVTYFFCDIGSVVHQCLEQSVFCHESWWFWWNSPWLFLWLLVYQPYLWSCFIRFPDVS